MKDLGLARAIILRPTPPDSTNVIWGEQTDVIGNPNVAILRYFDFAVGQWVALKPNTVSTFVSQEFTATSAQTVFTLASNVLQPTIARVNTSRHGEQDYLIDFKITNGTIYNTLGNDNNVLTLLGSQYTLFAGEKVKVTYIT